MTDCRHLNTYPIEPTDPIGKLWCPECNGWVGMSAVFNGWIAEFRDWQKIYGDKSSDD